MIKSIMFVITLLVHCPYAKSSSADLLIEERISQSSNAYEKTNYSSHNLSRNKFNFEELARTGTFHVGDTAYSIDFFDKDLPKLEQPFYQNKVLEAIERLQSQSPSENIAGYVFSFSRGQCNITPVPNCDDSY